MKINQAFTILQSAGGIRAARIITEHEKKMTRFKVWRMARQLRRGVPVAKIIHQKWFYGLKFYTNKYTLDPRPDTETLVAAVINDCGNNVRPTILDLGSGTGCIIASLIKNINGATGLAIEKSWQALRVTRKNIKKLGLDNKILARHGDFCSKTAQYGQFDIIVSNPPYIARGDNRVDAGASHDPDAALYAAKDGLAAYIAIAKNAQRWIKNNGKIYLEIGINQDTSVRDIFVRAGWEYIRTEYDLGGIARVLVFTISQE